MKKVVIVGYGNIGQYAHKAVDVAPDMEVVGIVEPNLSEKTVDGIPVVANIADIAPCDVALLCTPSRSVPDLAEPLLRKGIATVDSYDIHNDIFEQQQRMSAAAKAGGTVAVTAAGWDPGTDSVIRVLLEAMLPKGITYTDFGPGMSMGHSVVARSVAGVADALSMTIPTGTGVHRRMVYITLEVGADFATVAAAIKADSYFCNDDTHVILAEDIDALRDMGHGVRIERKGVSGDTHNQKVGFDMSINNPALTSQIMVSCARAAFRQVPGCYTMPELPPIDLLPGEREGIIRRLV
ncbi:MAG: diaminopimelate dehydrogenase [Oscillospiraceae bacterium]|nr:diaminopimelate dehydrogenase [Oscillospiraceae bacterium]